MNRIKKRIIVSVTNDLVTDQRVHKTCMTLKDMGFEILLVGRLLPYSLKIENREYDTHRMKLLFTKGVMFYAEFNIRLFFFLLFKRFDVLTSNDLDTLLSNYIVSLIRNKPLVYDSHEYFTEVPEIIHRPIVQKTWKLIEKFTFPKVKYSFTVSDSIAELFEKKYGKRPLVVRNIPKSSTIIKKYSRKDLKLPEDKFIIILQGAGINVQRGAEEAVEAMLNIENAILLIVGSGDIIDTLKEMTKIMNIQDKVIFRPKQEYPLLMQYTLNSDIGLSIDKDTNVNYRFSLPNKIFDYIRAEIPILASDLIEIKKLITKYNIGDFIPSHDPVDISKKLNQIIRDPNQVRKWKENIHFASKELTWENEAKNIEKVYSRFH